jgi:hypothetical protein
LTDRIFGVGELANVVAAMPAPYREAAAYLLAKVSCASHCALVRSHPRLSAVASPCSIDAILQAVDGTTLDAARARETLGLLESTTIASDGCRFLDADGARALAELKEAFDRSRFAGGRLDEATPRVSTAS